MLKRKIYENIITESLIKKDYSLHFYKPNDNHELEFIIEKNGEVVPIEVKAGNTISTSLNNFIKENILQRYLINLLMVILD